MGACNGRPLTQEEREAKLKSKQIEEEMRRYDSEMKSCSKVLLLGNDEAGKSTIFRQNTMLFTKGHTKNDLKHFKFIITANIIEGMSQLVKHSDQNLLSSVAKSVQYFSRAENDDSLFPEVVNDELAMHIKQLWSHPIIRKSFEERYIREILVHDHLGYFFEDIDRIKHPEFAPSREDILKLRVTTTGVVEQQLTYKSTLKISLVDVGGQRNERKKWIHHFDRVTAIVFVAAISEFDQVLFEDQQTNRLQEALDLWGELCNLPFFGRSHLILVLNKKDLLKQKLAAGIDPRVACPALFQNFQGPLEYDPLVDYIVELFAERNDMPDRSVICHITCATDSVNVFNVFEMVYDTLLEDQERTKSRS
jgi:GTPase SAR1 family protein